MNRLFVEIGTILGLLLASFILKGQSLPADFFASPVKHDIRLAGTFGELRTNHFHMGIDIKSSKGVSGDSIFAVADGFISRVKVQAGGYGNALYIDHPNGYTSVYAHLKSYEERIARTVRDTQYTIKEFEIDIKLGPGMIPVEKGEFIGIMGTTGYSFGPHLHFEIRETHSEIPVNPLLSGYGIKDNRKPVIQSLSIYHLNNDLEQLDREIFFINPGSGQRAISDTIAVGAWRVGFGISSYDPMDDIHNKNGIYNMRLVVDGEEVHRVQMDSISFEETRGLNAHIDYAYYKSNQRRYQRCYALPGIDLRVCENSEGSVVKLYKEKPRYVQIFLEDFSGNENEISFYIRRKEIELPENNSIFNYILPYGEDNVILRDDFKILFPEGSLYETLYLHYRNIKEESANHVSDIFHIHDNQTPIHLPADLYLKANITLHDSLLEKVCLVNCTNSNDYVSWGGEWKGNWFYAPIEELGSFCLYLDTIAPRIELRSFRENMQGWRNVQFNISDNLGIRGNAKLMDVDAYIDDEWVLMEYDLKKKRITHWFDKELEKGPHRFKLIVRDDRGNASTFESEFQY